jgi:CHAD domain-containing protein
VLDQTAEPGDTAAQVQRQLGLVQDTLVALKAREADLPGLPTREELRNTTDRLREQAAQVEVPAEITQKMQKVREMLAGYEQKLQQPFEQEGMLMDEHAKLVDARATRAGLDARVDGLEEIVGNLESEQPAPDTAAE